jgi:hypothetical protein
VALVDADEPGRTKARLYLVTLEQFSDILAQENWLEPGSVVLDDAEVDIGAEHMYGLVLSLGELDDHPILTFSQHRGSTPAAPSAKYLQHIARGLREAYDMTDDEIVDYLAPKRGIAGALDAQTLRTAVGSVGA